MLPNNKKGLTLIETLIAMSIAAAIMLGFFQLCSTFMVMVKNSRYRVSAINIARAEIEDVRANGYAGITMADFPKNSAIIIDEGTDSGAGDDMAGVMTTTVKDTTNGPISGRKIIVELTWVTSNTNMQETLETVIYAHQ